MVKTPRPLFLWHCRSVKTPRPTFTSVCAFGVLHIILLFFVSATVYAEAPDQPLGIKGSISPLYKAVTLLWEPVKQTASGQPLNNLAGYNIYKRSSLRGPAEKINSYLVSIPVYADRIDGQTFYYSVRAVDGNGNESVDSLLVDSSPNCNVIFLAEDGRTSVIIPNTINDLLRPSNNKYGVPLAIRLKEENPQEGLVVRNLQFQFLRGDTKQELSDLAFALPDADIQIGYDLVNGQIPLNGEAAGAAGSPTAAPNQLVLTWHNGVTWVKLGGVNNGENQFLSVKSSQLGHYQLRVGAKASSLALGKANIYPALFTPNGDGHNDQVYMVLENPNNAEVRGDIFDLAGRHIATLPPPTLTAGIGTTLTWSGNDEGGSVVPSDLYVYRIQGDGQIITGTVAVAR